MGSTLLREQLKKCKTHDLTMDEQEALVGAVKLTMAKKEAYVQALCAAKASSGVSAEVKEYLVREQRELLRCGLIETDLKHFFHARVVACLPLPTFTPENIKSLELSLHGTPVEVLNALVWRVLGLRHLVNIEDESVAKEWLAWGKKIAQNASSTEWANVAGTMRLSNCKIASQSAVDQAFEIEESSRAWMGKAALLMVNKSNQDIIESYYLKAIELDQKDAFPRLNLGNLYTQNQQFDKAEKAYRQAIELDKTDPKAWNNLGNLFTGIQSFDQAETAYLKAIDLDASEPNIWCNLGHLLEAMKKFDAATTAYQKALALDSKTAYAWLGLAKSFHRLNQLEEAIKAYSTARDLNIYWHPNWRNHVLDAQTQLFAQKANKMLQDNQLSILKQLMQELNKDVFELSITYSSEHFVEHFLALTLKQKDQAKFVLDVLREMNADRFARPLLIAFEAAIEGKAAILSELEPEMQSAAKRMYERLTAKPH